MPVRQSAVDRGKARGHRFVVELSRELEDARTASGLSYAWLGKAVGISGQQAARICRGESPGASIVRIAGLLAAAGLDLSVSVRTYPAGPPVRDAAHLALLARFRARIAMSLIWRAEVPVLEGPQGLAVGSGPPDRRAWDAVIEGPTWRVGVEAETPRRRAGARAPDRAEAARWIDPGRRPARQRHGPQPRNHRARSGRPALDVSGNSPTDPQDAGRGQRACRQHAGAPLTAARLTAARPWVHVHQTLLASDERRNEAGTAPLRL